MILNEFVLFSHLGNAESVYSFFFSGVKGASAYLLKFADPLKLVLRSLKCLNMTIFKERLDVFRLG